MQAVRLSRWTFGVAAAAATLVAGCGGGGGGGGSAGLPAAVPAAGTPAASTAPAAPGGGATTSVLVRFNVGAPSVQSVRRTSSYVPPTVQGIALAAIPVGSTLAGPLQAFDVSAGSGLCSASSGGGRSCQFAVNVPPGASILAVTTYDAVPAGGAAVGNALSTAAVPVNVTAGQANAPIALTLAGIVANAKVAFGAPNLQLGATGTEPVLITAYDADGNAIVGADLYANPLAVAVNDPTGAVALSASAVVSPSTPLTLSYNGAIPPVGGYPVTVTAAAPSAGRPPVNVTGVWRPDAPRGAAGSSSLWAVSSVYTLAVASPYPTPSFGSPAAAPTPVNSPSSFQISETRATAPPSVSVLGTPITARSYTLDTYSNGSPFQTVNNDAYYGGPAVDGGRVDGLTMAEIRTDQRVYGNGTSTATRSWVWPTPLIAYKSPLTNGDAWTNSVAQTFAYSFVDNRPTSYTQNVSDTTTTAADASFVRHVVDTYSDGTTFTADITARADGTLHEVDVDTSAGITETDDVVPNGGSITVTAQFAPNGANAGSSFTPVTYTATGTKQTFSPLRTDTESVTGPVALDARCGLAAPATAYLENRVQRSSYPGQSTTVQTDAYYVQPGVGIVCDVTSTVTQTYWVSTWLTVGAKTNSYIFLSPTQIPAQTSTTVSVRSLLNFTAPSSLDRAPASVLVPPQTVWQAADPGDDPVQRKIALRRAHALRQVNR